jgi:hypothetical protein
MEACAQAQHKSGALTGEMIKESHVMHAKFCEMSEAILDALANKREESTG